MENRPKQKKKWASSPPFIDGPERPKKKLKRENYPFLSDEEFKWVQEVNDMPGEGFSFE